MDNLVTAAAVDALKSSLGPIRAFLDDPSVQEIMINGENDVWVESRGEITRQDINISTVSIKSAIQLLARLSGKNATAGTPDGIVDARMEGFRIAAALNPTSIRGPSICIRKHNPSVLSLAEYVKSGTITEKVAAILSGMIIDKKNILIAGSTSSGKTTFCNALLQEIPSAERILTIEDTPELKVSAPDWVALESNAQQGVTTRMLVRLALRYRPDRIIVGEVRDAEAYDLLQAANTGHDGCIATLHANSSKDALSRLETLILQAGVNWPHASICAQIAQTFDYVIFMTRVRGVRRLAEIMRIVDYDKSESRYITESIYHYEETL